MAYVYVRKNYHKFYNEGKSITGEIFYFKLDDTQWRLRFEIKRVSPIQGAELETLLIDWNTLKSPKVWLSTHETNNLVLAYDDVIALNEYTEWVNMIRQTVYTANNAAQYYDFLSEKLCNKYSSDPANGADQIYGEENE